MAHEQDKHAQVKEQAMREARDRQTKSDEPKPQGEPKFRTGADRSDLGRKGHAEVRGEETPPKHQG
ncbi:MAG: hypothetical protein ABW199_00960 [Caulobacterales bacterium]